MKTHLAAAIGTGSMSSGAMSSGAWGGGLRAVAFAVALGCGLVAGTFFAFSTFVMPALNRLPPAQAVAAMQSINRLAVTPLFMLVVFGTALACLGLAVRAGLTLQTPGARWILAGCLLYLVGAIAVTVAANVPLNNALAVLDPHGPSAAGHWAAYVRTWTAWNHVRCVASLAATGLLIMGVKAA
jgi:uncharacterized membrane protein